MKNILKLLILFIFVSFLTNCMGTTEAPAVHQDPIFDGTKQLELYYNPDPLSKTFTFTQPSVCKTYILAIFDEQIETSEKTIVNTISWKAGSRTTLDGFTLDNGVSINMLYTFDADSKDFINVDTPIDSSAINPGSATVVGSHNFAIWCFADDWSIPYSSGQYGKDATAGATYVPEN